MVNDTEILILASLADSDKHGYAMVLDIGRFAGVELGRALCTAPSRGWSMAAGSARAQPATAGGRIPSHPPAGRA